MSEQKKPNGRDYSLAPIIPIKLDGIIATGDYVLKGVCRGSNSDGRLHGKTHGNNGPIALGEKDGKPVWLLVSEGYAEELERMIGIIECAGCIMQKEYDRFVPDYYH